MAFEALLQPGLVGLSLVAGCGRDHVDDLASARDQVGECPHLRNRNRASLWPNPLSKQGDDFGIEPIGLGEPTDGARKRPDQARIDDGEAEPGTRQRRRDRNLETALRLEDDEFRGEAGESRGESFEALSVVRQAERLAAWPHADVQALIGDVDAEEDWW